MPYSDIRVFYFRVLYCTIVGMTNWFIGELFWSRMSESIQARRDIRVVLWLRSVVPEGLTCPINDTRHTVLILQAIYWIRDPQLQCIKPNVTKYGASLDVSVSPKQLTKIHTHYIHSMVVQDFVSGRAYCVNQYHYESLMLWCGLLTQQARPDTKSCTNTLCM